LDEKGLNHIAEGLAEIQLRSMIGSKTSSLPFIEEKNEYLNIGLGFVRK
jgi:hypothetical protein